MATNTHVKAIRHTLQNAAWNIAQAARDKQESPDFARGAIYALTVLRDCLAADGHGKTAEYVGDEIV